MQWCRIISVVGASIAVSIATWGAAAAQQQPLPCDPSRVGEEFSRLRNLARESSVTMATAIQHDADFKKICALSQSASTDAEALLKFIVDNKSCFRGTDLVIKPAELLRKSASEEIKISCVEAPLRDATAAFKEGDYRRAKQIAEPLALRGEAQAEFLLGHLYESGLGVPQDYAEAVKWYRRAADQGVGLAQAAELSRPMLK